MNISSDTLASKWMSAKIVCTKSCGLFAALVVLVMIAPLTADDPQDTAGSKDDASVAKAVIEKSESQQPNAVAPDAVAPDAVAPDVVAPESSSKPDSKESIPATKTWTRLPIAVSLPDGRPLRPIGIYQSQMDELIPQHYRPVAIDRLNEAITQLTDRATDDQASRLKGAVYWVEVENGKLVSDRSEIDIESDLQGEVRRSLGIVNLAIEQPQNRGPVPAIDVLPRLESEPDGNLVAVFRSDDTVRTGIRFKWQLRGTTLGSGHEFVMRIPRTPQTRIVVSVPTSLKIEVDDGVLRSQPNPPPDADATDPDLRWYEIDAGGLTSVRIRTRQNQSESEGENFVVRESSVHYQADPSGLTWTSSMVVQLPASRRFPALAVSGTAFTAVKVNGTDVPFTTKTIGGRERHLQIELPRGIVNSQAVSVNVIVTGHTTWSGPNGWCDLPMPIWIGDGVVYASVVDDVRLEVFDPLRVMSWELPSDWKQAQEEAVDDGVTEFSADGPPIALAAIADPEDPSFPLNAGRNWSRVRLIHRPLLKSSSTALRLEVVGDSLNATARVTVKIDLGRVEPLRMIVEPGWALDSVSFVHSGRVIEYSTVKENSRVFVLWPEAEDVNGSEIVIEAKGTKILSGNSAGLLIPPTWFVRALGARGDFLAAIVPPADLNWSGDAAMQLGRIEFSELTDAERDIFSGLDQDVLWFRPQLDRTPAVSLQTPTVSFSSATVLQIQRDPDEGEVTEQLVVKIESPGQSLPEFSIQTGPTAGRPPLQWSISGGKDSPSTSVPSSDVIIGEGENDGIYTIDISDKNFRGRRLVARRRYPVQQQQEIQLPSIPGATSQSSEVLVGPGLLVKNKSRSVQMIPLNRNLRTDEALVGNVSDGDESSLLSELQLDDAVSRNCVRLRYDAVEQPSVVLTKTDVDPNVTIVWREQIRVVASSRGSDRIEATYKVSPTAPLEIEYEPELQLASVSRDGQPVDLITIPQQPADVLLGNRRIVLEPRLKTENIRVMWNRSQFGSSWLRQCRIPKITVSGIVLKSEYQLISSSDTFAPAALIRGQVSEGRFSSVEMREGENATLVRRNLALAIGWLFAILAFALSWFIAERAPLVVAAMVVVLAAVVILWWPWKMAVIGWLVVPAVAAAMLATSRAWSDGGSGLETPSDSSSGSHSSVHDSSKEFSLEALARFMVLMLVVPGCVLGSICKAVTAQDAGILAATPQHRGRAVNVLVPVNKDGEMSGEMIYVPRSVQAQLFRTDNSTQPQDPRFQSASYRVKIDPAAKGSGRLLGTTVEAEYLIHVEDGDRTTNLLRLPLTYQSVRRIELIDEANGLIRFEESSGQVIAALPKGGDSFRLRVTLIPAVSESEQWTKMSLRIPPVASSELMVEAEQNLDALRVGGTAGSLLEETDLRRWVEALGPTDSLEIDYRTTASASPSVSKPLQRRYWINAGKRQVTIDCEVDPPNVVAAGESFQFIVRDSADSPMPSVTSQHWRLDGSEVYSSTRRLITVTSTRDSPGPVRLLWTQPATLNFVDESVPLPIRIPDVIAAGLGENAPAWVALHCDTAIQFAPLNRDNTEPLSVDVFLAAWSGYRGRIDRAYVALDEIQSPILQIQPVGQTTASQRHDLHVAPDRLELHYNAMLSPNDSTANRSTLRLPRGMELISVSVNDQQLDSLPIRSRDLSEVMLGTFAGSEPVTIKAIAVQFLPQNKRFSPPRLAILPAVLTEDRYTISRDRSVTIRTIKPPLIQPVASEQLGTADSLTQGSIPVADWMIESDGDSDQLGSYEVKSRQTRFDCRQLITLDRDHTRWSMETLIAFRPKRVPDFIDVEIPTRWCESLEVSPTTAWSRQPATDPSRQIIRIRCDAGELEGTSLSIRGHLQSSESVRVNVPSVRVLGLGQRQVYINVPDQLINEPIQWRTSAVEAVELPDQWKPEQADPEQADPEQADPEQGKLAQVADSQRSTYLAANPSWSIDLAPLPEVDIEPNAISCDIQVFAKNDGALAMCHWDLLPGSLETVDIRLPSGSTCLGLWTAGQAVVAEPLELGQSAIEEPKTLRVPLSLSRFSQTIEMLIRVPSSSVKRAKYLPELIDIPVNQIWLTNYVPVDSITNSQLDSSLKSDRAVALARSVVQAVEVVDQVAERPRDEVAVWFELWLARYRLIAASTGHLVNFDSETATFESQWSVLDARMSPYVKRFSSEVSAPGSGKTQSGNGNRDGVIFGVSDFDGFVPERVTKLSAVDRPRAVQPVSSNDQGLRNLIVNLLTLILVGGVLVCLRPIHRLAIPVVVHPAFWLGLMGIFAFAVAPVPVAAAIILVAVSLPVFPSRRPSSAGSDR